MYGHAGTMYTNAGCMRVCDCELVCMCMLRGSYMRSMEYVNMLEHLPYKYTAYVGHACMRERMCAGLLVHVPARATCIMH